MITVSKLFDIFCDPDEKKKFKLFYQLQMLEADLILLLC